MKQRTRRRLSPHFVIEEFDSHDGAHVPAEHIEAFQHLVDWWLTPLRSQFGPVTILSGYRSLAHNASVGGARKSVHLLTTPLPRPYGRSRSRAAAADVTCAEGSPADWSRWAGVERQAQEHLGERGRGGIGTYITFVHLDTGPWRRWAG
jgi:uncharacterized protein YcbK (DUF882 family)